MVQLSYASLSGSPFLHRIPPSFRTSKTQLLQASPEAFDLTIVGHTSSFQEEDFVKSGKDSFLGAWEEYAPWLT